jgi:hypothetical protein
MLLLSVYQRVEALVLLSFLFNLHIPLLGRAARSLLEFPSGDPKDFMSW